MLSRTPARRRKPRRRPLTVLAALAWVAVVTVLASLLVTGGSPRATATPAPGLAARAAPGAGAAGTAARDGMTQTTRAASIISAGQPGTAQAAGTSWAVRPGQTLSGIAAAYCGTAAAWPSLASASGIPDGNRIFPGQRVTLDCHARVTAAQPGYASRRRAGHAAAAAAAGGGDGLAPGGAYCKPDCWGDGDGDGFDLNHPPGQAPVSYQASGRRAYRHSYLSARAAGAPARHSYSGGAYHGSGSYSQDGLARLWISAGGPAGAAAQAARIAECESGGRAGARNPSGATGVWQILGQVVGGNLNDPQVNARNAVAKYRAAGGSFSPWVCK